MNINYFTREERNSHYAIILFLLLSLFLSKNYAASFDDEVLSPDNPNKKQTEADWVRRVEEIKKHKEWSRKIVRFIKAGEICLGMNEEQMKIAWGKPLQESAAFASEIGELEIFVYPAGAYSYTVVLMKNKKIIGWSQKVMD
jgi:hypothetical protein